MKKKRMRKLLAEWIARNADCDLCIGLGMPCNGNADVRKHRKCRHQLKRLVKKLM